MEQAIDTMAALEMDKNSKHIHFGQILGMCDVLTLSLGAAGYNSNKLLLYGEFEEVFPWLLRRLDENRDMMGAAQMELPLIHSELKRRLFGQ